MPTDHLEPYRQMARSIRFVPPLDLKQATRPQPEPPSTQMTIAAVPVPSAPVSGAPVSGSVSSVPIQSAPAQTATLPADSDHTTHLIQSAVSEPTVLPPIYILQENIGDRISRLADPEPPRAAPVVLQPKIPQPDPNWKPAIDAPIPAAPAAATLEITVEPATEPAVEPTIEPETVAPPSVTPDASSVDSSRELETTTGWFDTMASYMEQVTHQLEHSIPEASPPAKTKKKTPIEAISARKSSKSTKSTAKKRSRGFGTRA